MTDLTNISSAELTRLKHRVKKLAREKSYLQLYVRLMNRMSAAPGLDNAVENMLRHVLDIMGGTNLILYYILDKDIFYSDVYGKKMKLEKIDDDLVKKTFETREPSEHEHDFTNTKMMTNEFSKSYTMVFPLTVGKELIGVFKIESPIMTRELQDELPSFFNFAALILKNEIMGQSKLKQAYDQLSRVNTDLTKEVAERERIEREVRNAKENLEEIVMERTADLRSANEKLEIELTRRKLLEISRSELLAERQAILENVPVGIAYLIERRFTWWNSRMADQFGYGLEELTGKTTEVIYPSKEDFEELGSLAYAALARGETFCKERLMKRKDKSIFWCSITGKAIDPGNRLLGSIWIIEDISKRKDDEEELIKAREEALSASRAKSEFLANMSHEIRTPMNSIIGFNKLLLDSNLNNQQKLFAEAVSQASASLLLIINDILDFSKLEAAKVRLDLAGFDLENLLRETINMFQPSVDQKKLGLRLEIPAPLPKVIIGDKGKLRQVLTNLLDNAIKFTPSGSIEVKVRKYDDSTLLPQKEDGLTLIMSVADTGVGIPSEQIARIFEAFIQGDSSSTKLYRGTGLGLAITKRLVEIMGGSIWVESRSGTGSIFYFSVKFEVGSDSDIIADKATDQHERLTLNPLSILLAEDDTLNQKFGLEILQRRGHTVSLAKNGKEVIDLLNKETFDLILMDVSMPEMDGIEATKEIRMLNKNIPIIAQTAHAIKGDREKFLEAGMDGYISKPIDVDQLVKEIDKIAPRYVNRQTGTGGQTNEEDRDRITGLDEVNPVIDVDTLRRRFHGKKDFFLELFSYFRDEFPKRVAEIDAAIEIGDLSKLSHLAHSFKGVAATVCAAEIADYASKLHQAAREDDLEGAKLYVGKLNLALQKAREISIDDFLY
ncbi:MAG: response regulator [Deltaproteobacteria bacterium]|nr:response regulator [Deltaproteobacteria bacterium]